jgi:predicted nucleic acid-binding protein
MIDKTLIPKTVALDTCVLIHGLGTRPNDPRASVCKELLQALSSAKTLIVLPVISLAEYLHGASTDADPVPGVFSGIIDSQVARILAKDFPPRVLIDTVLGITLPRSYVKYDSLIAACAKRYKVDCLITYDTTLTSLAKEVGLRVETPDAFKSVQGDMFEGLKQPEPKQSEPEEEPDKQTAAALAAGDDVPKLPARRGLEVQAQAGLGATPAPTAQQAATEPDFSQAEAAEEAEAEEEAGAYRQEKDAAPQDETRVNGGETVAKETNPTPLAPSEESDESDQSADAP